MSTKRPVNFTVSELKERLRELNLPSTGSKAELMSRLIEADPAGQWADEICEVPTVRGSSGELDAETSTQPTCYEREIEMCRREKELAERELRLARKEMEMMREQQRLNTVRHNNPTTMEDIPMDSSRTSITAIADLLSCFDGNGGSYENWERQLRLLRATYCLPDGQVRVLIGMRLKGKALEWLQSKPEYLELSVDDLLNEMRDMYDHRPSRLILRKQFEDRGWKREETFHQYVHEKVILANRVPIIDDEIIDYLIEGIPVASLRDQARIGGFLTIASLLRAFERVTLRDRVPVSGIKKEGLRSNGDYRRQGNEMRINGDYRRQGNETSGKRNVPRSETEKRCFNCGLRNHVSLDCPTKKEGPKCFKCGERGHIASKCVGHQNMVSRTDPNVRVASKKCQKEVDVNGHRILTLIDTGSDITLMCAKKYAQLGSPRLDPKKIRWRGLGSGDNTTLGEFNADLTIDGHVYPIPIHVAASALMSHDFLLGTDFLNSVEVTMRAGKISVSPLPKPSRVEENVPEIFQINVDREETNEVDLSHLSDLEQQKKIKQLIDNYSPMKSREVDLKMTLILKDEEPVYQRARRLSVHEKNLVNAQIEDWINTGIVQPSLSEYASPVVLAKKKNGSVRLCIDYRQLNKKVIKDRYPLPLIEDQLDALQEAKFFSTIDLKNGFFHVAMHEQSRKYTAFIIPDGHYEFLRVPFGLCNSPAVFQRFINIVFQRLIQTKVVLAYMDDLILPTTNRDSGIKNLEIVLKTASEAGLEINWQKCSFLKRRVDFLGHTVEDGRVYPSVSKIEAVQKFPEPGNVKQIQSFLGLSGYFRKFIPRYSAIARPLSDLLRVNVQFKFGERERDAFVQLKELLSHDPVLHLYSTNAETEVHTDASMQGYGAILLQKKVGDNAFHPIYYSSSKTTSAEQKYPSYELEVLAIIKALKKFRVYLLGIPFTIVTDCNAFKATMNKKDLCVRVARWALQLEEFQYTIEHRPGKNMTHVDALSRHPLPTCNLVERRDGVIARLRRAQQKDNDIVKILDLAESGKTVEYIARGGLLFKRKDGDSLLVVPKTMQSQIIREAHEIGHFSVTKTEAMLRKDYWIPQVKPKIEAVVRNCVACILAERKRGKQEGFLNPIEKGEVPLDTYHVDHLGPLPSTAKNYKHVFVIIDAFSKFVWLYATKTTSTAEVIDKLQKQAIVFGNPRRIISDRGVAFTSNDFSEYCVKEGISHVLTTTGIPRANGQVERVNQTLIPLLTKLADPKRDEWYKYLSAAQQCINTTVCRSINESPFRLLYGVYPRLRSNPEVLEVLENEWREAFQNKRDGIRQRAKENIVKIQLENKRKFDKNRVGATLYQENDLVAIKRTQRGPGLKLATKYLGPYRIIQVMRNNRYLVQREGEHEGPYKTSTAADYMKPWVNDMSGSEANSDSEGSEN